MAVVAAHWLQAVGDQLEHRHLACVRHIACCKASQVFVVHKCQQLYKTAMNAVCCLVPA